MALTQQQIDTYLAAWETAHLGNRVPFLSGVPKKGGIQEDIESELPNTLARAIRLHLKASDPTEYIYSKPSTLTEASLMMDLDSVNDKGKLPIQAGQMSGYPFPIVSIDTSSVQLTAIEDNASYSIAVPSPTEAKTNPAAYQVEVLLTIDFKLLKPLSFVTAFPFKIYGVSLNKVSDDASVAGSNILTVNSWVEFGLYETTKSMVVPVYVNVMPADDLDVYVNFQLAFSGYSPYKDIYWEVAGGDLGTPTTAKPKALNAIPARVMYDDDSIVTITRNVDGGDTETYPEAGDYLAGIPDDDTTADIGTDVSYTGTDNYFMAPAFDISTKGTSEVTTGFPNPEDNWTLYKAWIPAGFKNVLAYWVEVEAWYYIPDGKYYQRNSRTDLVPAGTIVFQTYHINGTGVQDTWTFLTDGVKSAGTYDLDTITKLYEVPSYTGFSSTGETQGDPLL